MLIESDCKIVSVTLNEQGELEVIKQYASNSMYTCNPPRPVPDTVVKEVYHVEDGKIVYKETIQGKHTPSSVVPETIEF